jgi:hypothetical protein
MDSQSEAPFVQAVQPISERLNKGCFCITLDRDALDQALEPEVGDADFCATSIRTRPHVFSNTTVFLSDSDTHEMLRIVRAIAAATRLPGYQQAALSWGPEIAVMIMAPLASSWATTSISPRRDPSLPR